jgi:hypothetical protein
MSEAPSARGLAAAARAPPAAAPPAAPLWALLTRAPTAGTLILASLSAEDRKALRLAHPELHGALDAAAARLRVPADAHADACARCALPQRYPSARRWLLLQSLTLDSMRCAETDRRALAEAPWERLERVRAAPAAAAVMRAPRLRELELLGATGIEGVEAALAAGAWPLLERVEIVSNVPGVAAALGAARRLPLLRGADLGGADEGDVHALAAAGWRLDALTLRDPAAGAAGAVAALAVAGHVALRRLRLSNCRLDGAALAALAAASWPLEELALRSVPLHRAACRAALAALARGAGATLRELDLHNARVGAAGLAALLAGEFTALTSLNFGRCKVDGRALPTSARLAAPALRRLAAPRNLLRLRGAELVAAAALTALTSLDLASNRLHADGVAALFAGAPLPALAHLCLDDNRLEDEGGAALGAAAAAGKLPALAALRLERNRLTGEGVAALAAPAWPALAELHLGGNYASAAACGVRALGAAAAAGRLPALRVLGLGEVASGADALAALARCDFRALEELVATARPDPFAAVALPPPWAPRLCAVRRDPARRAAPGSDDGAESADSAKNWMLA